MLFYGIAFSLGLAVGSFVNVCVYRIPLRQSLWWPSSRCPACSASIAILDNIPILSYLWLQGRCRSCRTPISVRYPLIELASGLAYAALLWRFGIGWETVAYALLCSALLAITFIDLDHMIVPDVITLPGIPLGFLCATTVLPVGWVDSGLGILLGGGFLWAMAGLSPYLFGREGLGGGDIKLLAMIGAFLGWKPALLTVLIGALAGSLVGVSLLALKKLQRNQYLPFGPFLALGALVSLFFQRELLDWYLGLANGTD